MICTQAANKRQAGCTHVVLTPMWQKNITVCFLVLCHIYEPVLGEEQMSLSVAIYLAQQIFLDCNWKGPAGSLPGLSVRFIPLCHLTLASTFLSSLPVSEQCCCLGSAQGTTSVGFKTGTRFWIPAHHTYRIFSVTSNLQYYYAFLFK